MIQRYLLPILLAALPLQAGFIEFEEFEEFEEFKSIDPPPKEELVIEHPPQDELEGVIPQFCREEMIAAQENREEILAFIRTFSEKEYRVVETKEGYFFTTNNQDVQEDSEMGLLLERFVKKGGTVIDYGAESGLCTITLSHLVGREGKVIAFEESPILFREMFWNLALNHVQNAQLFCTALNEKKRTLDSLKLEDIALIRINADGREDLFLTGAQETIKNQRPILIINMIGGIPLERADRFVRDEFQKRMDEIHRMGYTTEHISKGEYLALPK